MAEIDKSLPNDKRPDEEEVAQSVVEVLEEETPKGPVEVTEDES